MASTEEVDYGNEEFDLEDSKVMPTPTASKPVEIDQEPSYEDDSFELDDSRLNLIASTPAVTKSSAEPSSPNLSDESLSIEDSPTPSLKSGPRAIPPARVQQIRFEEGVSPIPKQGWCVLMHSVLIWLQILFPAAHPILPWKLVPRLANLLLRCRSYRLVLCQ